MAIGVGVLVGSFGNAADNSTSLRDNSLGASKRRSHTSAILKRGNAILLARLYTDSLTHSVWMRATCSCWPIRKSVPLSPNGKSRRYPQLGMSLSKT